MTQPNEPVALLPCPFCGSPPRFTWTMGEWVGKGKGEGGGYYGPNGSRYVCTGDDCNALTPAYHGEGQDEKAIAAWNRRAYPARAPQASASASLTEWLVEFDNGNSTRTRCQELADFCRENGRTVTEVTP